MIHALLLVVAQSPLQSTAPVGARFIDPRVVPHVRRYRECVESHVLQNVGHEPALDALREAYPLGIEACQSVREHEYSSALRALRGSRSLEEAARNRQTVEDAFRSADNTRNLYMAAIRRENQTRLASPPEAWNGRAAIDVPYQAIPAFTAYTQCIADHVAANTQENPNSEQLRSANSEALVACQSVREQQLSRALALQTDHRLYGSQEMAHAAVRRAFDQFDRDFAVVPIESKPN